MTIYLLKALKGKINDIQDQIFFIKLLIMFKHEKFNSFSNEYFIETITFNKSEESCLKGGI